MIYKRNNRPNRHKNKYISLGIILGVSFTVGGFYVYDNYKQPIIENVNQIKNTAISEIPKSNPLIPVEQSTIKPDNAITEKTQQNNIPIKEDITPSSIASALHILVNLQRVNNGLPTLEWDDSLASIALSHSNDMLKNNYFDHNDLQGRDPSYRLNCNNPRENIAWTDGYNLDQVSKIIIDNWMNSQEHRDNILNTISNSEGIGVSIMNNHVLVTEDFC